MICLLLQGISQDLQTGCPNLVIAKFCGILFIKGPHNVLRVSDYIYIMYLLIEIKHIILIQCDRNYIDMKKLNYMLEVEILRYYIHTGVLRDTFWGFGCPNGVKMPLWLRLWCLVKTTVLGLCSLANFLRFD